jgi:ATP-binding cassette subfamily B protein
MAFEYLLDVLRKNPVFKEADSGTLVKLIQSLKVKRVDKGTRIIKQGDAGDLFYIIHMGKVSVKIKKGWFSSKVVAHLTNGDCFGEMALVTNEPRSATVTAVEYTELFTLAREEFNNIIMHNRTLKEHIEELVAKRLEENKKLQ